MRPIHLSTLPLAVFLLTAAAAGPTNQTNGPAPAALSDFAFVENQGLYLGDGTFQDASGIFFTSIQQFYSLDLSTAWSSDAPAWTKLSRRQNVTGPDAGTMTVGRNNTSVLFFGGTVYEYDIKSKVWPASKYAVAWGYGFERGAVTDTDTGLIYGIGKRNFGPNGTDAKTWRMVEYNEAQSSYNNRDISDGPSYKSQVSTVYSSAKKSLYSYEWSKADDTSALFQYDIAKQIWSQVSVTGEVPPQRGAPCLAPVYKGKKLILSGGGSAGNNSVALSDVYLFDVATSVWTKVANAPKAYYGSVCAVSGDSFILWGGYSTLGNKNGPYIGNADGPAVFNIVNGTWGTSYTPGPATGDSKSAANYIQGLSKSGFALLAVLAVTASSLLGL